MRLVCSASPMLRRGRNCEATELPDALRAADRAVGTPSGLWRGPAQFLPSDCFSFPSDGETRAMQQSSNWIRRPLGGVVGLLVALSATFALAQDQPAATAPAPATPTAT